MSEEWAAVEVNATKRPSSLIDGAKLECAGGTAPAGPALTRRNDIDSTSTTHTSSVARSGSASSTRFVADEANATNRPSAEIDGSRLEPLACTPSRWRM